MKLLAILLFSILGCGYQGTGVEYGNLEFKPYVDRYLQYKLTYLGKATTDHPITIQFGDLVRPMAGVCNTSTVSTGVHIRDIRVITIDQAFWRRSNDCAREIIILHEMGHCDLDYRGHIDVGPHVMNTYNLSCNAYEQDKENILSELFGGIR